MTYDNEMTELEFQNEVIKKGYNIPVLKEWEAKHFNDIHAHENDLFLYVKKGELVIGVEHKDGLEATTLERGNALEVLAGAKHYESVSDEGVIFLVAKRSS